MRNRLFNLLFAIFLPIAAFANGPVTSGGGNAVKLDFLASADTALLAIEKQKDHFGSKVDSKRFRGAITADRVVITEEVLMDRGQKVDAYYDQRTDIIKVNQKGWQSIPSQLEKMRLAAHEIFRRMGIDDDQYQLSKLLSPIDAIRFHLKYELLEYNTVLAKFEGNVSIPLDHCITAPHTGSCNAHWVQNDTVKKIDFIINIFAKKNWNGTEPATYDFDIGLYPALGGYNDEEEPVFINVDLGMSNFLTNAFSAKGTTYVSEKNPRKTYYQSVKVSPWSP